MFQRLYPSPCRNLPDFDEMNDEMNDENTPLAPLDPNVVNTVLTENYTKSFKTRSGKEYTFIKSVPEDLMALYNNPKKMLSICRKQKILSQEVEEIKTQYRESLEKIEELEEDNTALYQQVEDILELVSEKDQEIERLKKQLEDSKFATPIQPFSSPNRRATLTPQKRLSLTPRRKSICFVKDAGFIRVFARVRPFVPSEDGVSPNTYVNHLRFSEDGKNIYVYKDQGLSNSQLTKEYKFTLDRVFSPKHSNEDVFSLSSLKDDIGTVLNGGRVSIFAYGHTGSGKTYTMVGEMGKRTNSEIIDCHGILQKSLMHLFFRQQAKIHLSVIEVYGDQCFDLIDGRAPMKKSVETAEKVPVKNMNEVLQCIDFALENRTIAETQGNTNSSRSHCIFRITVESMKDNKLVEGVFNVIDLAGSEKPDESLDPNSQIRKETQAINKSLCLLSSVIKAKIQGNNHVPYRDTLLTALLKKDLSQPESKMNIIINISPRSDLTEKTLNSLQFVKSVSVSEIDQ